MRTSIIGHPEDLVHQGAHALFSHGIGHLLGLDVHDMEKILEIEPPMQKDGHDQPQFGTGYLRMDMDLKPNMVVTIEPGFYICPAIFADPTLHHL